RPRSQPVSLGPRRLPAGRHVGGPQRRPFLRPLQARAFEVGGVELFGAPLVEPAQLDLAHAGPAGQRQPQPARPRLQGGHLPAVPPPAPPRPPPPGHGRSASAAPLPPPPPPPGGEGANAFPSPPGGGEGRVRGATGASPTAPSAASGPPATATQRSDRATPAT